MCHSHAVEDPRSLAHESGYSLQQAQISVQRLAPDVEEEGGRVQKAKRAVVICGLGGKGKRTAGTLTFETDEGPIVYGLDQCTAPTGVFENVLVKNDVKVKGISEAIYFDASNAIEKTGRYDRIEEVDAGTYEDEELNAQEERSPNPEAAEDKKIDFNFSFKKNFGENPDPRTLFDFSKSEVKIEITVNPHRIFLEEIEDLPLDEAGLRIGEIYNEVELRALHKALEAKFNVVRGKEKILLMRLLRRVEQQIDVAEAQAERAELSDELGLDPEMSERIEDHPELASRLAAMYEKLTLTIMPTAEDYGYEQKGSFTEDKRGIAEFIADARRKWDKTVRRTPDIEHRDAADQAQRLKAALRLLTGYRRVAGATRGVKDTPEAKKRFAEWNTLVRETLIEAEFLSGTAFISLGKRHLEIRKELEEHEQRVERALQKLLAANVAEAGLTEAGPGAASQATAGELLRDEFTVYEVREALERLGEINQRQFDLVMASGQLSWALLELYKARGLGKEAAEAELSSLHSAGQGFLAGYSLRALELEESDPSRLRLNLSGESIEDIVATIESFVKGLLNGFGKGLRQITVELIEAIAVESVRDKIIDDLVKIVTKLFTEEKFRFDAGAAMAEIVHDKVEEFSESNSQAQAGTIGDILGQIVFEILIDLLGGGAASAVGKMAKFTKMRAVLRLVRMTASNTFAKAVAGGLFELTEIVANVGKRVGATMGKLQRKIPGFTSQKKFADAVHDMKALDDLQGRIVDVAREVGRNLDRVEELAALSEPDPSLLSRAMEDLRKAERKLELEVKIYNKKAGSADTLLARKSSKRPGPANQEELRAELELLYEQLRLDKNAKDDVRLFDEAVHVYKKVDGCWERHSSPEKTKRVCLTPPKGGQSIEDKAARDAAAVKKKDERNLPQPITSEAHVGDILKSNFPSSDWESEPLFLYGKRIQPKKGRNPQDSTKPDWYSENLKLAVEHKSHPLEYYKEMISSIIGNFKERSRIISMPKGTRHWVTVDIRRSGLPPNEFDEHISNIRRDIGKVSEHIEKIILITDKGPYP
jgi:hypothetical protein